jgi:DNA modification methylase
MTVRYLVGDVFSRMQELPAHSVDLVMTSPPFLALRSYLPADHPLKAAEIGSEPTPADFLDTLLYLTAEWREILAPHGSICVELGDTYAGSGGAGGDYGPAGLRSGQPGFDGSAQRTRSNRPKHYGTTSGPPRKKMSAAWPLPKSLTGIPTLYAWSLAYGFNLLTGETSPAGQWRIRNLVAWVRPNPPVGALGDKFRPATSYLVIACTSGKRWFDLDAVRTPAATGNRVMRQTTPTAHPGPGKRMGGRQGDRLQANNPAGAPPLDWWKISTRGYKGSHYAVFPPELCERPIKAMCPQRVCTVCGEPSWRITRVRYEPHGDPTRHNAEPKARADYDKQQRQENAQGMQHGRATKVVETAGWTDCGHDAWRPGVVLDPFAGTGTTLRVAHDLGRDAIGIDLDERNVALALERVGPLFLEVDYGRDAANEVLMNEEAA